MSERSITWKAPDKIKLTKSDLKSGGQHHIIPLNWVAKVDAHVHLNKSAKDSDGAVAGGSVREIGLHVTDAGQFAARASRPQYRRARYFAASFVKRIPRPWP